MESNYYTFIPTVSGTYWLRLGVNQNGKTYRFQDINIGTSCSSYIQKNTIINKSHITFVPKDCNDYSFRFSFENVDSINIMTLTKIYGFEE